MNSEKTTLTKQSASTRSAGYVQARKGRRPLRVDTLLSKSQKSNQVLELPKEACSMPPFMVELAGDILRKSAAQKQEDADLLVPGAVALGGAGVAASPHTRGAILGYKRVYHGTDEDAARVIREQGLRTSKGGSGAAAVHGGRDFVEHSTGRVHVAPSKTTAKAFAQFTGQGKGRKGEVLKADLPLGLYEKFEADPDMFGQADLPESVKKHFAVRSTSDVPSEFIHGGKGFSRIGRLKSLARGMPGYIKQHPRRFAGGLAAAGLGTTAAVLGGREVLNRMRANRQQNS